MDPKFQTSFIPKKQAFPVVGGMTGMAPQRPHHRGAGVFMLIGIVVFVVSLGALAGAYFWKQYLTQVQVAYKSELAQRESQFKLELITTLKQWNAQIDTAKKLLDNHLAVSKIFGIVGSMTAVNVRFVSLDFSTPTFTPSTSGSSASTPSISPGDKNSLNLTMKGYGSNLAAVAFQSDVLAQLADYGLSNIVKNPMISDPSLESNNAVSFGFSATVNPASLSYEKSIIGDTAIPEVNSSTTP
ncbi:MAG: hypothetical protein WCT02_04525 [Candidatus Paceibacterota bacterium]